MSDGAMVLDDQPSDRRSSQERVKPDDTATNNESAKPARAGMMSRLKGLLGSSEENTDALAQALQNGNGVAAGLSQSRRDMIERVIAFDSKNVEDVMIPRADIVAVETDIPLAELLTVFSDAGHSRLPVFRGDLDDPVGMIHIRDVVALLADPEQGEDMEGPDRVLSPVRRKLLYVPPSMKVTDLLLRMQAERTHMALVIDEFGGTDGLVTIEDLIEEIVGEIQDEHDEDDMPTLRPLSANSWEATARLPLEDLEAELGLKLHDEEDEVDTLGGLVFTLAGRVPLRGEVLTHEAGIEFEITDADPRRIRMVKLRRLVGEKAT